MYSRALKDELLHLAERWSVISITGPRQSGKTTLCKMAFPTYHYVNLEDASLRSQIERDIKSYLLANHNGLIIDEAQYLPEVFSYVQVVVDENPQLRYVLSGSSDFLLMQSISQSLAGRVAVKRLLPLSLKELGDTTPYSPEELMVRGFYPAVWGDGKEPSVVYDSYLTTYIQRDVRQIINIKDLSAFQRFITLCAARVGNEFYASAIANELGISYKTIQEWLSVLEASYVAFTLQPYYRNVGKRLVKTPKLYFYDVGLVCFLLGIDSAQILYNHPLRGAIFENMVVCDMLKDRFNQGKSSNLFYYRDKSQREVDVVQETAGGMQIRAYEIKSALRYNPEFVRNLDYFRKLYGESVVSTQVIFAGTEELPLPNNGIINFRNIPQ